MKKISFFILLTLISFTLKSQSLSEKVALETCSCLDSLSSVQQIEDSLKSCIANSMIFILETSATEDEKSVMGSVEGLRTTIDEVNNLLPYMCYNIRKLVIEEKSAEFSKLSENKEANMHYYFGNDFMDKEDFESSVKEFKKAVKLDKNFVYAYDHLAISYRRLDKYKKAISYYKKSLEIFPEGDVALLNIAVAYTFDEKYDEALKYYNRLKYYYIDNPEGYFGAAKIFLLSSDYENALDNIFTAHLIYYESGSAYISDSEQVINLIYSEMKEKNMLDTFTEYAIKYNITFDE